MTSSPPTLRISAFVTLILASVEGKKVWIVQWSNKQFFYENMSRHSLIIKWVHTDITGKENKLGWVWLGMRMRSISSHLKNLQDRQVRITECTKLEYINLEHYAAAQQPYKNSWKSMQPFSSY
jgi:hypothetical protein